MQIAIALAALLLLAAIGPYLIDAILNRRGRAGAEVRATAGALHRTLWIADLHADSLLWNRDLLREHRRGHVDLPRLVQGNVALQVFTAVTKVPLGANFSHTRPLLDMITPLVVLQRWPPRTWHDLHARARYQAEKLHRFARDSGGSLVVVETVDDVNACRTAQRPVVAGLLGIEGAHALEGNLSSLDALFTIGFRLMGLAHFHDNEVAGSAHGVAKGGLTPLGRQVVHRMQQLGMIVDLAHASPAAIDDVVALATKPVLVSHTGVRATCDGPRNLTNGQLQLVAAAGGVIGIAFFRAATGGTRVDSIARAVRHTADLIGADHVALGSDFDGAVRTPFDSTALAAVTDALLAARFTDHEVAAIMGENVRRFLLATLPRGSGERRGDGGAGSAPA